MLLFSLNVEGSRHLDRWLPLVKFLSPDVVCLGEVLRQDISHIRRELGMDCEFVAQQRLTGKLAEHLGGPGELGIALLSPHGLSNISIDYYRKPNSRLIPSESASDAHRCLLSADIHTSQGCFRVGTVHFTWSPMGENSPEQATDLENLFALVDRYESITIAGDFNIPRGTPLFEKLAQRFAVWTPQDHDSSLDSSLHKNPAARVVVDHLISSHDICGENVDYIDGVSDHKALVGQILKAERRRQLQAA